jgi:hypothetical protein
VSASQSWFVGCDGEDIVGAEDDVVVSIHRDFCAAVLAIEDDIADFDVDGGELAAFEPLARADGENGASLGLFLGAIRKDDAAGRLFFLGGRFDDDAIVQRLERHCFEFS